ncbi:hypothetical protein GCM10010103_31850 [Streptomyces paradoxus]
MEKGLALGIGRQLPEPVPVQPPHHPPDTDRLTEGEKDPHSHQQLGRATQRDIRCDSTAPEPSRSGMTSRYASGTGNLPPPSPWARRALHPAVDH